MLRPLDAFRYRGPTLAEGNDAVPQGGLCGAITPSAEKADYGPFLPKKTDDALFPRPLGHSANPQIRVLSQKKEADSATLC